MATITGKDGVLKFDTNAVSEVVSFTVTKQADTVESTRMGSDWATHLSTFKRWTAEVTCFWDPDDTLGQQAPEVGETVVFQGIPEGDTTGNVTIDGSGILTEVGVPVTHDGMVQRTFQFQGTGALSEGVVV